MAFKILFIELYALLQLYLISIRSTVAWRALGLTALVGAFTGVFTATAFSAFASHYWPNAAPYLLPIIEEGAKAALLVLLIWSAGVGKGLGILDFMLYGAAIGAGLAFAEGAIYTMEWAKGSLAPSIAAGQSIKSILLSWLPGGWTSGTVVFSGHLALAAVSGLGIGIAQKTRGHPALRWGVALLVIAWVSLLHISFNSQPDPKLHPIRTYLFLQSGSGGIVPRVLFLGIIGALIYESYVVRRLMPDAQRLAAVPFLLLSSLRQGWRHLVRTRAVLRHRFELENYRRSAGVIGKASADVSVQLLEQRLAGEEAVASSKAPGVSSFQPPSLQAPPSTWVRRAVLGFMMVFAFWLIFIAPFRDHNKVVEFVRGRTFFWMGIFCQAVIVVALVNAWRHRERFRSGGDAAELLGNRARLVLAWTGAAICLSAWKRLYDHRQFPYPLIPTAQLLKNVNDFVGCFGANTMGPMFGGLTGPTAPVINPPPPARKEEDDPIRDIPVEEINRGLGTNLPGDPTRPTQPQPQPPATGPGPVPPISPKPPVAPPRDEDGIPLDIVRPDGTRIPLPPKRPINPAGPPPSQ